MRKFQTKIINLIIFLISLVIFVLAETKNINIYYPWHSAIVYALGAIGIVHIVKSVLTKKILNFGFGFFLLIAFFIYFLFVTLKIENIVLGLGLTVILIVLLYLVKYLFGINSYFQGDNKKADYKNYKERRKEEALDDLTKTDK